jgi:hypothetical protein
MKTFCRVVDASAPLHLFRMPLLPFSRRFAAWRQPALPLRSPRT